jgi:DNA-binding Lrp family transcriptional regulator
MSSSQFDGLEAIGIKRGGGAEPCHGPPESFAIVGLESQKELVLSAFEKMVADWPEVRECHMIRGGGDFLLRLVARDTAHENALTSRLTAAEEVARVQTLQTIRTSKDEAGVPLGA